MNFLFKFFRKRVKPAQEIEIPRIIRTHYIDLNQSSYKNMDYHRSITPDQHVPDQPNIADLFPSSNDYPSYTPPDNNESFGGFGGGDFGGGGASDSWTDNSSLSANTD